MGHVAHQGIPLALTFVMARPTQRSAIPPFALVYPSGVRIHRDMTEDDAASIEGHGWRDLRNGYVWYKLPSVVIEGEEIGMSLCFFHGRLSMVTLAVIDDRFGTSWSDWSEEKERARTAATEGWLDRIGFPVGKYPWGLIFAEFDHRGGGGGGGVRYEPD